MTPPHIGQVVVCDPRGDARHGGSFAVLPLCKSLHEIGETLRERLGRLVASLQLLADG